jgi:hypothetical protein
MATYPPIPNPEPQFLDADGHPYAGGTLATYIPGTTSPKQTWSDHLGGALNTNPIILDSAGRCIMYGDGEYRLILRDALGNLVWDQYASTLVSLAMAPVIIAPTLEEARRLLGIDDAIAAAVAVETNRALAAEAALQTAINNETTRATNAENALGSRIDAEIAARIAADNALSGRIAALESGGVGDIAEVYTVGMQTTSVSIANASGRPVQIRVTAEPGYIPYTGGAGEQLRWQASGSVTRDGVQIGVIGYRNSSSPGPDLPLTLDHPAAGTNTYQVAFYIDPEVTATSGYSDWNAGFALFARCYIWLQLF